MWCKNIKVGDINKNWEIIETQNSSNSHKYICKCVCGYIRKTTAGQFLDNPPECISCKTLEKYKKYLNHKIDSWKCVEIFMDKYMCKTKLKCVCGTEKIVTMFEFLKNNSSQCRSCAARLDIKIGETYNKWTVLELVKIDSKFTKTRYRCKCECGFETVISGHKLVREITTKCRECARKLTRTGFKEITGQFFSHLRVNANRRNLEFNITIEELQTLFEKQNRRCALTGLDICLEPYGSINKNTASVDRIDSSKGYNIDNIQWLHKDINNIKQDYTQTEFINYCKLVAEKFKNE